MYAVCFIFDIILVHNQGNKNSLEPAEVVVGGAEQGQGRDKQRVRTVSSNLRSSIGTEYRQSC